MEFNEFLNNFSTSVKKAHSIYIYPHVSADGDTLGSTLALKKYFDSIDKESVILIEEVFPSTYKFMYDEDSFEFYDQNEHDKADLHISVDTGDINRLGKRKEAFKGETINIDHHKTNTNYAKENYVDYHASSSGEIIYEMLIGLGCTLTKEIAVYLYVAISTDTGGFRYSNTNENCFKIASELIKFNINISDLSKKVFETNSIEKTLLMGKAIEKLRFFFDSRVAVVLFRKEEYLTLNANEEMFDGIIQIPRNIEGVIVAAVIRQSLDDTVKVNLRSNDDQVDVSKIAFDNNGGGHKRAAGYTSNENMDDTLEKLLHDIEKQLK
ncbi:MAG: bifunctional oligoribonuclease/PAP phosphatase NrnA [Clostridia bacterium]|nr:bifunctional oligoribonuclease/PAP phosphatase NrnA [Clostridia bacterium]